MVDNIERRAPALRHVWERLLVALGRGGKVLLVLAIVVTALILVMAVLTWVTGLGPDGPGREHY